jgi:hypothetical protein
MEHKMQDIKKSLDEAAARTLKTQEETGRGPGGRELALVFTKIQEAQLWLGAAMLEKEK